MNYTFLQNTKVLINNNCVFFPRTLEFHWVQRTNYTEIKTTDLPDLTGIARNDTIHNIPDASIKKQDDTGSTHLKDSTDNKTAISDTKTEANATVDAQNVTVSGDGSDKGRVRRNAQEFTESTNVTTLESRNATFIQGKFTKSVFQHYTRHTYP